jgi:hypothetical protein
MFVWVAEAIEAELKAYLCYSEFECDLDISYGFKHYVGL